MCSLYVLKCLHNLQYMYIPFSSPDGDTHGNSLSYSGSYWPCLCFKETGGAGSLRAGGLELAFDLEREKRTYSSSCRARDTTHNKFCHVLADMHTACAATCNYFTLGAGLARIQQHYSCLVSSVWLLGVRGGTTVFLHC